MIGITESDRAAALDEPLSLSAEQISAYQRDGFIRIKNVLPAELLELYRAEVTRVVRAWNSEMFIDQVARDSGDELAAAMRAYLTRRNEGALTTYDRAFTQCMNLWRHSTLVAQLVHARRLSQLATELMQVAGVRLYHDQALFKEPGGGHTPWHADQFYWPLSNDNTVTAWIPLQPISLDMGPLSFARGSHLASSDIARELSISDESEAILAAQMANYPVTEAAFEVGEISFHSGWTCHRAGPNTTDTPRAAFTIIYLDKDIRMIEPRHRNHTNDAALWLPGVAPGMTAASPINPVLYNSKLYNSQCHNAGL